MSNSLQEQLLKAGLANQKKLRQVAQEKRQQAKQQGPKTKAPPADAAKRELEQAVAEKQARDWALNQQKQEAAKAKERAAQIKQIIEQHQVSPRTGEIAYHFTDANKIKTLYVTPGTQAQLVEGRLAITAYQEGYALIPSAVVEKLRQRDPAWFVFCNQAPPEAAADDPYADYPVPDDLIW